MKLDKQIIDLKNKFNQLNEKLLNSQNLKNEEIIQINKDLSKLEPIIALSDTIKNLDKEIKGYKEILENESDEDLRNLAKQELPLYEKDLDINAKLEKALSYMDLKPGQKISEIKIDTVFIGSCTNSRIEDLRAASKIVKGKKVSNEIRAMIVPGSGLVKEQAEKEGLDAIFKEAGFDWREPGCSMCLAMNADRLSPGERAASTSNRNFEGRQGRLGRTHLVSPEMAAAAAIKGYLTDVRNL